MSKEAVKLKDSVTVRLYNKEGKLIMVSKTKSPSLTERILTFLLNLLEEPE